MKQVRLDEPRGRPARVGEISVVGNTRTGDRAILDCLTFSSAQLLPTEKEIVENEFKLLMKFYKRFDMDNGKRPRIEVRRDDKSPYCDITIEFPEKAKKKKQH